jgi:hypothetical protein
MLSNQESLQLDLVFVPEARRRLAGDEITGTVRQMIRVLKGRWTRVVSPALLPERNFHFASFLRFHRRLISTAPPAQRVYPALKIQ